MDGLLAGGIETRHLTSLNGVSGLAALVPLSGHYVDPLNWRAGVQGIEPVQLLGPEEQSEFYYLDPLVIYGLAGLGTSLTPGLHALDHGNPVNPHSPNSGLRWMGSGNYLADYVDYTTDPAARATVPGSMDLPTIYSLEEYAEGMGCLGCVEGLG